MHDLLQIFLQTVNNFCPADYTGFIWDACQGHHSNPVFNSCTSSIIAAGIAIAGDFFFGSGNWSTPDSTPSTHTPSTGFTDSSSPFPSSMPSAGGNYDTVLSDNLPIEFGSQYQISDLAEIFNDN